MPMKLREKVVERAFMGETRDYVFATEAGLRLRVVTSPTSIHDVGADVWVSASADQIVDIASYTGSRDTRADSPRRARPVYMAH